MIFESIILYFILILIIADIMAFKRILYHCRLFFTDHHPAKLIIHFLSQHILSQLLIHNNRLLFNHPQNRTMVLPLDPFKPLPHFQNISTPLQIHLIVQLFDPIPIKTILFYTFDHQFIGLFHHLFFNLPL